MLAYVLQCSCQLTFELSKFRLYNEDIILVSLKRLAPLITVIPQETLDFSFPPFI